MPSISMEPILVAAIAFAFSQICLSILMLARMPHKLSMHEWLFLLFLITVVAYLLTPIVEFNERYDSWVMARRIVENFLPGLFWLFCSSLFIDRFRIQSWHLIVILITVVAPLVSILVPGGQAPLLKDGLILVPQLIEFVLLGLALYAVIKHWSDDLIEERRDLRLWFCAMTGVYIFGLVILREFILAESAWFAVWQYLPVGIICLFTNLLLMQYRSGLLSLVEEQRVANTTAMPDTPKQAPEVEVPDEIVSQLDELMNQQHVYREMGLTIGELADRLELPEYRLRKIINAGLGFRNFNDYLNGFRIKEAGQRLADPGQNNEAILNIALDTGFRSLSSFNKAFREEFDLTPTAFRQQHNAK